MRKKTQAFRATRNPNEFITNGPSTEMLIKGGTVLINTADLSEVKKKRWHINSAGYCVHHYKKDGKVNFISLHRFLLEVPTGFHIDHANRNPLDNRRSNLRICTPSQNQQNRKKPIGTSSQYKGVCWHTRRKKWMASIKPAGSKIIVLGFYKIEEYAADAYNKAALKNFGQFANINIIPGVR